MLFFMLFLFACSVHEKFLPIVHLVVGEDEDTLESAAERVSSGQLVIVLSDSDVAARIIDLAHLTYKFVTKLIFIIF